MTQNRSILLNIVATYGRNLYALAVGLLTAIFCEAAFIPLARFLVLNDRERGFLRGKLAKMRIAAIWQRR